MKWGIILECFFFYNEPTKLTNQQRYVCVTLFVCYFQTTFNRPVLWNHFLCQSLKIHERTGVRKAWRDLELKNLVGRGFVSVEQANKRISLNLNRSLWRYSNKTSPWCNSTNKTVANRGNTFSSMLKALRNPAIVESCPESAYSFWSRNSEDPVSFWSIWSMILETSGPDRRRRKSGESNRPYEYVS